MSLQPCPRCGAQQQLGRQANSTSPPGQLLDALMTWERPPVKLDTLLPTSSVGASSVAPAATIAGVAGA